VYERAETKGRQALLRFRANQIADYEALEHFHFWPAEPEPKYIYYIGQSKNFQEWYQMRKNDQGEIYKDFEEKSTIYNQAFMDVNYDDISIWEFTKCKKKEDSIYSTTKSSKIDFSEYSQEIILEKINEMQKSIEKTNLLINQMYTQFNIVPK
jgi:hypothetical protein